MVRPVIESRERFSGCLIGSSGHEWKRGLHSLRPMPPKSPRTRLCPFLLGWSYSASLSQSEARRRTVPVPASGGIESLQGCPKHHAPAFGVRAAGSARAPAKKILAMTIMPGRPRVLCWRLEAASQPHGLPLNSGLRSVTSISARGWTRACAGGRLGFRQMRHGRQRPRS